MDRPFLRFREVITRALGDVEGLRIADLGCGSGGPARALVKLGAEVTGLEPGPAAIEAAREQGGGPTYIVGSAEAAPLPDRAFDVAIFVNSLHHVPDIAAALSEARRITCPGGRLAVIEPEAGDPGYQAMRMVDDEAPAYAAVRRALEPLGPPEVSFHFAEAFRVGSGDELMGAMVRADPSRTLAPEKRRAFDDAVVAALQRDGRGPYLESWGRIDVWRVGD